MQGDNNTATVSRTSSLTVQLQQAWLQSQIPKQQASKPLPLSRTPASTTSSSSRPGPSPRSTAAAASAPPSRSSSSSSSSGGSFSSRYVGKKPDNVNLSNLAAVRLSPPRAASSDMASEGSGWTPSSTLSRDSSGSAGFSDWSSPGFGGSSGDASWDACWDTASLPSPASSALPPPVVMAAQQQAPESPKKKLARVTRATDSYTAYVHRMLEDQAMAQKRCMGHESLAYQAVHNELAEIIGALDSRVGPGVLLGAGAAAEDGHQGQGLKEDERRASSVELEVPSGLRELLTPHSAPAPAGGNGLGSSNEDVENWIESLLSAPPPPPLVLEEDESDGGGAALVLKPRHHHHQHHHSGGGGTACADSADVAAAAAADLNGGHGGSCGFEPYGLTSPERPLPPAEPDLAALLLQCAESVHADDVCGANAVISQIRQYSSPYGTGVQRLAHYFTEGLVARLSGSGADLYGATSNRPSAAEMVRAYHMLQTNCPYVSMGHAFSNSTLLKVFEGASRVHIVDYGILYGFQWPQFIKDLAERPGGPPRLRITGIDFPQPGFKPAARLEETGARLAELANIYGVPFEFQAVASKWEAVHPASLGLRHDEVLAVSCIYRLRHLLDDSVMPSCPRKVVLSRIRAMNPAVFVTAVVSASFNLPFFLSRFRECLDHYSYAFDAMDSVVPRDCDVRILLEREILGREILNVVACEGTERVERPDTYASWQRRLLNAGFRMLPLQDGVLRRSRELLQQHHKDFGVAQDGSWLLLGWKNQVVKGLASWA